MYLNKNTYGILYQNKNKYNLKIPTHVILHQLRLYLNFTLWLEIWEEDYKVLLKYKFNM